MASKDSSASAPWPRIWSPADLRGLPVAPPYPPMEALIARSLPSGEGWQFEPKWDGFRCLSFRKGDRVFLQSKALRPLARYFPDVAALLLEIGADKFVIDGELLIRVGHDLSFEDLQLRLHPAESRVRMLAARHPASYMIFDMLVDEDGRDLTRLPLSDRRERLESFAEKRLKGSKRLCLSPATEDREDARRWLRETGGGLDGIVAKRCADPYESGERAMIKVKNIRSADCVVGGFRYEENERCVGSLLLGLYDDAGVLHHVGFTSGIKSAERLELTRRLEALRDKNGPDAGFTGRAPGGVSRWSTERTGEWEPLPPELVVEVSYDHFTGGRFRHGTRLLRWRPDKLPRQCTLDQVTRRTLPPWLADL